MAKKMSVVSIGSCRYSAIADRLHPNFWHVLGAELPIAQYIFKYFFVDRYYKVTLCHHADVTCSKADFSKIDTPQLKITPLNQLNLFEVKIKQNYGSQ